LIAGAGNPSALSGKLRRVATVLRNAQPRIEIEFDHKGKDKNARVSCTGIIALLTPGSDGWSPDDWWSFYEERAAIAEQDGGMSRDKAEAQAYGCCIAGVWPVCRACSVCRGLIC
jgi:hypothetical protein